MQLNLISLSISINTKILNLKKGEKMNSKISKRTNKLVKSVLASLLVSSNFLNLVAQNAKCMDNNNIIIQNQQDEIKYVRCIDDKFILDMLKDYAYYKKNADHTQSKYIGYDFINVKFEEDLEYLNNNVFNKQLTCNFPMLGCKIAGEHKFCIEAFNSYAVVHVIKTFFEKHEPIRLAFNKLYNEKAPNMKFFVKEFSDVGNLISSGWSRHKPGESITLEVLWDYCKKNGNYVGFEKYSSWLNNRLMPNLTGLYGQNITLAYELYNGLSSETRYKIVDMLNRRELNPAELYGMLYIIYNTLHELTHCTIFCLRHYNSDNTLNFEFQNCFCDNNFSKLIKKFKDSGINGNRLLDIWYITDCLENLKRDMNDNKKFDVNKRIAKFHGFTDRSTANHCEFMAELGALGNMPNCHDFINPKNFVELLDFYAEFALKTYK